jgi:hypothetical protein
MFYISTAKLYLRGNERGVSDAKLYSVLSCIHYGASCVGAWLRSAGA